MTMIMESWVSVCCMMAKLSSKYSRRGPRALVMVSFVTTAGTTDWRFFHMDVSDWTDMPGLRRVLRASWERQMLM